MNRINVIGTTGSGKSTFSRKLSKQLNINYIEMDSLYWKPSWGNSTDSELFAKVDNATLANHWVIDGNYSLTTDLKWSRADSVIWIDYSYCRTLVQLLSRSLNRAWYKKELWQNTGNCESFTKLFFSKHSILAWFFKCYHLNKKRFPIMMQDERYKHVTFIRLKNPKQAHAFLNSIQPS